MLQKVEDKVVIEDYRTKILDLEEKMKTLPGVQIGTPDNCYLDHTFADGLYVRTLFIPGGMLVVTKIHKHSHPVFVLKGMVSTIEENGIRTVQAPCSFITQAGTKRVCYVHENTVWTTVHATSETDLDKIEDDVIAKTFDDFDKSEMTRMMDYIKKEELTWRG